MSTNIAPTRVVLLSAVTAGTSVPFYAPGYERVVIYTTGFGTISTGTLLIEEADWDGQTSKPFEGTWSLVKSIDLTALTGGSTTGIGYAYHLPFDQAYGWLRARIGTSVTGSGGSATCVLRAN